MSIFKKTEINKILRDISLIKEQEQKLTNQFNSLNEEFNRFYKSFTLTQYLNNDLIIQQLVKDVEFRINYLGINFHALYRNNRI